MTAFAARALPDAKLERPLVAIVMDTSVSFDREIVAGAAQYAREAGRWQLYMEELGHRLPNLNEWQGHGILASFDDPDVVQAVIASGLPVVAVGGMGFHAPASDIPCVAADHGRIATLAADHFLELGLQVFGYYGAAPTPTLGWSQTRGDVFAARVTQAGFSCHRFTAPHGPEDWSHLQQALGEWLVGLPRPVGVMACDDSRGRHVLEACRTQGLRVPHDVAVIGVDDDELICELAAPPLTSIRQAARRIGYEAARLLDARIRPGGGPPAAPAAVRILVPPIGIVPGPPPTRWRSGIRPSPVLCKQSATGPTKASRWRSWCPSPGLGGGSSRSGSRTWLATRCMTTSCGCVWPRRNGSYGAPTCP